MKNFAFFIQYSSFDIFFTMAFKDPFANIEPPKKPKQTSTAPKRKKDAFDSAIKGVTRREASKATGRGKSTMHGKNYQLTTRVPLEMVDELRDWAAQLGMTQQDLQRYCFYRGLQALNEGERPEVEEVVVRKRLIPPGSR